MVGMDSKKLPQQTYKLTQAGIDNMKLQLRAYEKYKAGESLSEEEQGVIDRMKEHEKTDLAASLSFSQAALDKLKRDGNQIVYGGELDGALKQYKTPMEAAWGSALAPKTGYAKTFDDISRDYVYAIFDHDFDGAEKKDVLHALENQYDLMKTQIIKDYTGEESEQELAKLKADYETVMEDNVKKPLDMMLESERVLNEVRMKYAKLDMEAAKARGQSTEPFVKLQRILAENAKKIDSARDIFSQMFGSVSSNRTVDEQAKLLQGLHGSLMDVYASRTEAGEGE